MKDGKKEVVLYAVITALSILVIGLGGYIVSGKLLDKKPDNTTVDNKCKCEEKECPLCVSEAGKTMTKDEALNVAKNLYETVYNKLVGDRLDKTPGKEYTFADKTGKFYKVDLSVLEKYFSNNAMKKFKANFFEVKGEYYDYLPGQYGDYYIDDFFMNLAATYNIFGQVDQVIRTLTLVDYTDNIIITTGYSNGPTSWGGPDKYPYHLLFIKENNVWKIDFFEYHV